MPRRKRIQPGIPMASFGDIAFLLIIFFMVTSQFIKEARIRNIEEAPSVDIETISDSAVSVVMDGDGQLWLQGQPCQVEILEGAVNAMLEGAEKRMVMVRIDRRLQQAAFGPVLAALSNVGAEIALVGKREP